MLVGFAPGHAQESEAAARQEASWHHVSLWQPAVQSASVGVDVLPHCGPPLGAPPHVSPLRRGIGVVRYPMPLALPDRASSTTYRLAGRELREYLALANESRGLRR